MAPGKFQRAVPAYKGLPGRALLGGVAGATTAVAPSGTLGYMVDAYVRVEMVRSIQDIKLAGEIAVYCSVHLYLMGHRAHTEL